MIDKKDKKMESVLEESDSSHHRPSHSGDNDKDSSLPSEDVEVEDSVRSVDWQINCPLDTNRTGE